jgi:chaperone modulatory protein CbpM
MMRIAEFTTRSQIDGRTVQAWIEAEWLRPEGTGESCDFSEIDLARARLIADLRGDLGLNDDAIPVVLALIDQIHGLRRVVRVLIERQGQ